MNVYIIGTSHIARQSIREITNYITEEKPDVIALELDSSRASALLQQQKNKVSLAQIGQIGLKGYLFVKIGQYVQQKLGKMVGVSPGAEMKTALLLARKHQKEVAFIDQPLPVTLKNFSKALSWKEKWRFLADLLQGLLFPQKQLKEFGLAKFDLKKVPEKEVIQKMVGQLRERYPNVYKTLVEERNKYMVRQLVKLLRLHPGRKILAVVGAGHQEGMEELLLKVDVV